jgi:hypothetical protein
MKKIKTNRGIFTSVILYSVAACVLSTLIAAGCGVFLYIPNTYLSERNTAQKTEFEKSKKVLDTVDAKYPVRFEPVRADDLKTKLAQQGFTVLLDTPQPGSPQIHVLYGYSEIARIIANQASGAPMPVLDPKGYNWPTIRLVSMMYGSPICTTMVELSGGENKSEQKRQVWKWERKGEEWVPLSFSGYFVPRDVEISKEAISFILSPKNDTKLTKLFVLKK